MVGRRETSLALQPVHQPPLWAAACAGQQRLEFEFVRGIAEVFPDPETDPAQFLEITHALAGPACLHLTIQPWSFPHLARRLLPTLRDNGTLHGTPGLRHIPGSDPLRYELGALDGHGRLVFHLDADALDAWHEFQGENDIYWIDCTAACPPEPCPRQHLTAADRPMEHLLHQHPSLHPAEARRLRAGEDPALRSAVSRRLRAGLTILPPPAQAENEHYTTRTPLTAPPAPLRGRPPRTSPPNTEPTVTFPALREPAEIPVALLSQDSTARTVDQLALALARQLLDLLADSVIAPGDVLYDLRGLARALGGPRSTTDGTLVLRRTAARYGLVRNRPRRSEDPPAQLLTDHTMTWEISPAAPLLAPMITQELAHQT
ncbi:hypothetical protein [Streptomyces acidiscabies]|uniref:Uncharacterized protein n=1 Tax=Streptomyces acidiscabies TaxID=42234 RepID=A0ABU4MBY8_9ACTN|nr:hypothetical protein [Streptomyces acidiscabies]MDX3025633.1 hypothetical protein [Streptomyces acidiscabies]